MSWPLAAGVFTLGADLSWPLRFWILVLVSAVTCRVIWSWVLLRGPRGVRALEWTPEEGAYQVRLGPDGKYLPAVPADCRRYGRRLWLLRFQTAEGVVQLLLDPGIQQSRALRSLARRLFGFPDARTGRRSGRAGAAS